MRATIFEPVSQCSVCGLDFPESELMRHYRTGRLVDRLCNDERTASDNLAILKRPVEARRRAKQPVPDSEESTGQETLVLSAFQQAGANPAELSYPFILFSGTASGDAGISSVGSLSACYLTAIPRINGTLVGVLWRVAFKSALPRPAKGVMIYPINANAIALTTTSALEATNPPAFSLSTEVDLLKKGYLYEWQWVLLF